MELVIAWTVLTTCYAFTILPLIGSSFTDTCSGYLDDLAVGAIIHGIFAMALGITITLGWAFKVVTT